MPEHAIGIDVGGTRIRVGRIGPRGTLDGHGVERVERDRRGFAAQLARLVSEATGPDTVGVGIGIPGRVRDGEVLSAGYLDIAGLDLPAVVGEATGLPARIENDATMALAAEARALPDGAAGTIAMLTVGTGIGGAVAVDGRPWRGGGLAGQFGHIVVADEGPPCNCGARGCVETLSSGTAFGWLVVERGLPPGVTVEEVLDRTASEGACMDVITAWARPFARAVRTLRATIDPRLVVVGGGLGAAMVRALDHTPAPGPWFATPVVPARSGDDAGVIGAGLVALERTA